MDRGSEIRKQSREALFRIGVIAPWYLKDYQTPLYKLYVDTLRDIVVPNITRRFGKSSVSVVYAVEQAIRKKSNVRYATAFLSDLENFIEPIFDSVLHDCPEDCRPQWLAAKKTWLFSNGSRIRLVGLDKNPNGIRGNAIDLLIIDEAAFVAKLEYLYKSIIVPATMERPFKLLFPSTPPLSPEHFWARELVNKAKQRGTYIEMTIDAIADLTPDERKRLLDEVGGEFSSTAQREFFCKIVIDRARAVAPEFNQERHVFDLSSLQHIKWLYVGDSGGVRDKTAILKVGYCHNLRKVIIGGELYFEPHTPTPVIAKEFISWANDSAIILDAHGQTRVDVAAHGISAAMPQKDDFTAGIEMLNATLYNNEVLIDKSCRLLISTLEAGLLTLNRRDFERTESLGHCDAAAALIYALRAADKVTDYRPKPKRSEIFIPPPPVNPLTRAFG